MYNIITEDRERVLKERKEKEMRERVYAVIDTETLGGASGVYCPAYHCAGIALTKKAEVDRIDIVVLNNLKMESAFYGKAKKEYYRELLKSPDTIICYTEQEAEQVFSKWLADNHVDVVSAHNSGFDFCKTFVGFCVKNMEFVDIMYAFYDTIGQYRKFNKFCAENGYYTDKKNCQMTAEVCYRFITNDTSFIEEHTALADCEIEAEILRAVWKTHKKYTHNAHKGDALYKQVKCNI